MEKDCTSLPKLRRKIQITHEKGVCEGCIFLKGRDCKLPSIFNLDARFNCTISDFTIGYTTNFIFVKEEK